MAKKTDVSTVLSCILVLFLALIMFIGPLERGLFFREDYLPFFSNSAWLLIGLSIILVIQKHTVWEPVPDLALVILVGLYWLSTLWALNKQEAIDGALKYSTYLGIFLVAKYAARDKKANQFLRWGIVLSGIGAALTGLLAGAGIIEYEAAVVGGRIYGSFQYPNSLAAYSMFVFFVLCHSWLEAEEFKKTWAQWLGRIIFAVSTFMILLVIVLSYSRATWIIFALAVVLYFIFLPREVKGNIFARFVVSIIPVLLVNVPISSGLLDQDYPSVRKYLILGICLAAGLEVLRALLSAVAIPKMEAKRREKKPAETKSQKRTAPVYVWIIVCVLLVGVIVFALTTEAGQNILSKVFPESIVERFASITWKDRNLLARWFATLDAFAISKDYPLGGGAGAWDALYHRYQVTLYWFTEVHNHFAQVLVETGYPGFIAFTAFWILVLIMGLKAWKLARDAHKEIKMKISEDATEVASEITAEAKPGKGKKGKKKPIPDIYLGPVKEPFDEKTLKKNALLISELIGIAFAVFVLLGHSAVDFDLSLPAIAIALFAGTGSLLGSCEAVLDDDTVKDVLGLKSQAQVSPDGRQTLWRRLFPKEKDLHEEDASKPGPKTQYPQKKGFTEYRYLFDAVTILCLALLIMIPADRYYKGMVYGSQGIYDMYQGNTEQGRQYMEEAMKYDPYTPSYPLDIARTYIQEYFETNDPASAGTAKMYIDLALQISPNSLSSKVTCLQLLDALGYYDEAAEIAYEVTHMIPLHMQFYELLADTSKTALLTHAGQIVVYDLEGEEKETHMEAMKKYAGWIKEIPERIEERKARIVGLHEFMWSPDNLEITPPIHLALGQVYFLEGDAQSALEHLAQGAQSPDLADEAANWLLALGTVADVDAQLPEGAQTNNEAVDAITKLYRILSE